MLAHLLYSFVTEEYPQVFIKTYQKNLRVPCLFRCLIFKVRCLLKKGRVVSYHIIAALSTPFFSPSGFSPALCWSLLVLAFLCLRLLSGLRQVAVCVQSAKPSVPERLIILSNPFPFVNYFFSFFRFYLHPTARFRQEASQSAPYHKERAQPARLHSFSKWGENEENNLEEPSYEGIFGISFVLWPPGTH